MRGDARSDVDGDSAEACSPCVRHSPVCTPARTSSPSSWTRANDRSGAANRARGAVERRRGSRRRRCRARGRGSVRARPRTTLSWRSSELAPVAGRRARAACSVEPTMSVKRTVARTLSGAGPLRTPVRNSSTSSSTASCSPVHGRWSSPGSSTSRAFGIRAGDPARLVYRDTPIVRAMEQERRDADGREHVPNIDLGVHPRERECGPRAGSAAAGMSTTSARTARRRRRSAPQLRARQGRPSSARSQRATRGAARVSSPTDSPVPRASRRTYRTLPTRKRAPG